MQTSTFAALLSVIASLAFAGCSEPDPLPNEGADSRSCPEAVTQQGVIVTELGEHNVSSMFWSASYRDFRWYGPDGSPILLDVRAEWDAGSLGERTMQIRIEDSESGEAVAIGRGPSPIVLNQTVNVTEGSLRVFIEPSPETVASVGVGLAKTEMETLVTVKQTQPC